ncbi:type I restriction enzyme HsdR N-terminal domain-containing protein [Candidatus Palauibacter sp.]|uniref:type I restriction enzyme HsdR N-terminal domain-containing protein n=1 Tax=Candidatus Palauibacter sp. TaxID=3101350 RepID=UPI003CC65B2B
MQNLFVCRTHLQTEADVEALVIDRLLAKLRYPDNAVRRKTTLDKLTVGHGRNRERFRPDYVLLDRLDRPVIVLEAKAPTVDPLAHHHQVSGYALALNQRYEDQNPVRYVAVSNGLKFYLWPWDSDSPALDLSFADFDKDNPAFIHLRSLLTFGALDVARVTADV